MGKYADESAEYERFENPRSAPEYTDEQESRNMEDWYDKKEEDNVGKTVDTLGIM